jgi:hypothetical protein
VTPNTEYALPDEVVAVRVYEEPNVGSGGDWAIDGTDGADKYTEACATFATEQEARAAIPKFCENHGISPNVPVVNCTERAQNDRSGSR